MTKEELVTELFNQGLIDSWEVELLLAPDIILTQIPFPKYQTNSTGCFDFLHYQMN